jgi:Lrp/AsnC family transcriptional regulator of ectoine degradation
MMKIDRVDWKILAALQRDGRMTKLDLAREAGVSAAACWERLSRLEKSGVILGYQARFDGAKLGRFVTVLVEVTLASHRRLDFERFEAAIANETAVVSCDAVGGGVDYLLRVVASDVDAYQRLIEGWLSQNLGIARYFTYVVTKVVKEGGFPLALAQSSGSRAS